MTNNQINNAPKDLAPELAAVLTQTAEDLGLSDIGVSVGIVTPDGAWTGATGISNIDTQQATKPDDLFNIASISKAYTSSVILKLQEQGKLSLDDTIDQWLPEIASQITNGTSLTIRQILNGTGGLWDYFNGNEEFRSDLIADEVAIFFNSLASGNLLKSEDNIDATEINTSDFINPFPTFSLPEPTGDYAVGTTSYHFIDSEREETYTADPNDNREITAKVWYPSVEVPEADTSPYFSQELSSAIALGLDIPPADFTNVINSISTNSVANAPIAEAESEFPVLIFSHGFGDLPELNAVTAEELASQGYVVVSLNHTYDSLVNVFPDGRAIPQSPIFDEPENARLLELLGESVNIRAEDARFVLDELEEIDAGDDPTGLFSGKLDLERVGMYGYSLGGATAAKVLSLDSRFEAGINLDGGLVGDVANASLSQPFMFLNNEAFGTDDGIFNQLQQSFVENLQNEGYEGTIKGTEHSNFNDFSLITPIFLDSGIELGDLSEIVTPDSNGNFEPIDPQLALEITRDYTVAFFEQYLNNQESPLLQGNSSPYPEVIFQSYNSNPFEPNFGTVNGDVLEIDSANELIFAGSDNDLIDATASRGGNRIYAGSGDDTLILGTGDRLIAGAGADKIFASSGGDNTMTGGAGADQFWIAVAEIPTSPNIITDFDLSEDAIGIAGLGTGFDDLNISQQQDDVLIRANNHDLAIFQGITVDSLSADNFVFA